jgi:uncharacterized membrane protein YfcA
MASGFFGIGGGFLIVPGLMLATRMPIIKAVASNFACRMTSEAGIPCPAEQRQPGKSRLPKIIAIAAIIAI